MFPALGLIVLIVVASMVMVFKYTYYVEAFFDFIVSLGLYLALWQMLRAMSRVQYLQNNFEGKSMAKNFVSAFGISFLTTSCLNFIKSFWWEQYLEVVARAKANDGIDSVIFGCTEVGLLVSADDFDVPAFDTTALHAKAAMDFALS